jgi:hypothetical protein
MILNDGKPAIGVFNSGATALLSLTQGVDGELQNWLKATLSNVGVTML